MTQWEEKIQQLAQFLQKNMITKEDFLSAKKNIIEQEVERIFLLLEEKEQTEEGKQQIALEIADEINDFLESEYGLQQEPAEEAPPEEPISSDPVIEISEDLSYSEIDDVKPDSATGQSAEIPTDSTNFRLEKIGPYTIMGKVGEGGMGVVLRGRHEDEEKAQGHGGQRQRVKPSLNVRNSRYERFCQAATTSR